MSEPEEPAAPKRHQLQPKDAHIDVGHEPAPLDEAEAPAAESEEATEPAPAAEDFCGSGSGSGRL